jgi:hypothetical protein
LDSKTILVGLAAKLLAEARIRPAAAANLNIYIVQHLNFTLV